MSIGLFRKEHRDRLHEAVYLFGWCCGRQTRRNGLVYGGKGLSYEEIGEEMGESPYTVRNWVRVCKKEAYIEVKYTLYKRLVIRVLNQKKYTSKQLDLPISHRPVEVHKEKSIRPPGTDMPDLRRSIIPRQEVHSRMNLSMTYTETPELERATPGGIAGLIPLPLWRDFVEVRKQKHKPTTDAAVLVITRKLLEFQSAGDDPITVVEQSVVNHWADIFPLKKENVANGTGYRRISKEEQRREESLNASRAVAPGYVGLVERLRASVSGDADAGANPRLPNSPGGRKPESARQSISEADEAIDVQTDAGGSPAGGRHRIREHTKNKTA